MIFDKESPRNTALSIDDPHTIDRDKIAVLRLFDFDSVYLKRVSKFQRIFFKVICHNFCCTGVASCNREIEFVVVVVVGVVVENH